MDRYRQRGLITVTLIIYAALAITVLGAIGFGLKKVRDSGFEAASLKCMQAAAQQRSAEEQQAALSATALEVKREKAKVVYKTITERVNVEIEKPVYRNICFADDGVRLANSALAGTGADPAKPDPTLPDANSALGGERRRGAPKDH